MLSAGKITPALWRAFFCFFAVANFAFAAAPAGAPPELSQMGKPNAAEAAKLLDQFRRAGLPGEFYLEFDLRAMLRRGTGQTYRGKMWGGRNAQGALTRVELTDGSGKPHRLLIQNGERPSVWRFTDGRVVQLDVAALFSPLIPGVEITAFDVQMPFLYWPDATLEKITRVLGRPTYSYLFRPPAAFVAQYKDITGARAYLDAQFNQLLQTELLGRDGKVVKAFAFVNLKRVGEQYIPKQADYRNEATRDKTRLEVTAAGLNLKLPAAVFDSATLAQPAASPAREQVVSVE
jgi:hypothetical protein